MQSSFLAECIFVLERKLICVRTCAVLIGSCVKSNVKMSVEHRYVDNGRGKPRCSGDKPLPVSLCQSKNAHMDWLGIKPRPSFGDTAD